MTLNDIDDSNAEKTEDLQSSTSELSKEVLNDQMSHDTEDKEPIEDSDKKCTKKKSRVLISYDDDNKKNADFSKIVITDKNANEASDSQTNFDCIELGKSNFYFKISPLE